MGYRGPVFASINGNCGMIVVNLWGGPGAGKSTVAFGLLFLLKINLFKAEMVPEFAKDLVYERRIGEMAEDQTFIFAEQHRRQRRLAINHLDFAVSDSPLPLPIIYQPEGYPAEFEPLVMAKFNHYDNVNYFLKRVSHPFESNGRWHSEDESAAKSAEILAFLEKYQIEHTVLDANPDTPARILFDLLKKVGRDTSGIVPSGFPIPDAARR